jgi:predicted AAA+ superfamily ATPase
MIQRPFWTERIETAWRRRRIVWLSGVRRVGKTSLVRALPDVEYFDCELPSARAAMNDPEAFLRGLGARRVVIDEIHRLANPSELLKIAADHFPKIRVLATGSSTLQASAKFRDTLTGRKEEVWLTPMMSSDLEAFDSPSVGRRLLHGGLPPFFLADEPVERDFQEWMDSYWARDIQELFRVGRRSSFVRFVELILAQSGGMFEATRFAAPCEVSRPTISSYLEILEVTRVAHVVRPYSTRRAAEIVSAPKVYAFDTGFICAFRGRRDLRPEDLGELWEHYVLNELHAQLPAIEMRYWRDTRHREVDFVIARPGRSPLAIECKWSWRGATELPGLAAFRDRYPKGASYVVASDVERASTRTLGKADVEVVSLAGLVAAVKKAAS